jgi:hypothetical protein
MAQRQQMHNSQPRSTTARVAQKTLATAAQKESFKTKFADIVKDNAGLSGQFSIVFFDTTKTNYVINGPNGKSINVIPFLTEEELEHYRALKNHWQD